MTSLRQSPGRRPTTDEALCGRPTSDGRVAGPARIVRNAEDSARLKPGDVVICENGEALAGRLLFAKLAGVIAETGGALSSAAIVARESGIPAVFSVRDATTRIQDGQMVLVDGTRGAVSLQP